MSGVLDRMVQRARGELPAVEPLVPSQRTAMGARASFAVEDVEREVSGGDTPGSDRSPTQRRVAQRAGRMEAVGATSPGGRRETAAEKSAATERPDSGGSENPRPGETRERQEVDFGSGISIPDGGANEGASARQQPSRPEAPKEHEEQRFVETEPASQAAAMSPAEIHESSPTSRETQRDADVRPGETARTIKRERFEAELRGPEPALHAQAPMMEADEHTEIHITIGSIELRAPRTEPKAPPFRPRVTLDEFLKRRPEAGS